MQARPIVAFLLHQLIFGSFQFLAHQAPYGLVVLIGAWAAIVVATWVELRGVGFKIAQMAVQTAVFIALLAIYYAR